MSGSITAFYNYLAFFGTTILYANFFQSQGLQGLFVFILFTILTQWIVNVMLVMQHCQSSLTDSSSAATWETLPPWTLIFALGVTALEAFPKLSIPFANVLGYWVVSKSAQELTNDMILPPEKLANVPLKDPGINNSVQLAVEILTKMQKSPSTLFNEVTLENVDKTFDTLRTVLKPDQSDPAQQKWRESFRAITAKRIWIGKLMWIVYIGVFVCAVVQWRIGSRDCSVDPAVMERNYAEFQEKEKQMKEQKSQYEQVYTIS